MQLNDRYSNPVTMISKETPPLIADRNFPSWILDYNKRLRLTPDLWLAIRCFFPPFNLEFERFVPGASRDRVAMGIEQCAFPVRDISIPIHEDDGLPLRAVETSLEAVRLVVWAVDRCQYL